MLFRLCLGRVRAMLLEGSRRRKFTEPVAHHVFRHEDGVENLAVMDGERKSNELGRDH